MTGCTIYFDFDMASMEGNPFKAATPFGEPVTINLGNAFGRLIELEEALRDACERLDKAGFPALDLEKVL